MESWFQVTRSLWISDAACLAWKTGFRSLWMPAAAFPAIKNRVEVTLRYFE